MDTQPYNLFAQQKQQYYPGSQNQQVQQQAVVPGNVQGATVQDFAAGKRAANSQAEGYGANPTPVSQPSTQTVTEPQTKNMVTTGGIAGTGQRQQNKPITNMDELAQAMGYTSPQEEERLRKASVANQRIMAVGDALRHIGNIFNTVNGAPAQQFNNPVQEEYARYERGKALRDKANQTYLTYQQAKAAQDAKQRQWEMQFRYNAAKDARDYELKKGESEARNNLREAQLKRYETLVALDDARREGIINDNEYKKRRAELYPEEVRSRIAKNNRTGGGRSGGGRGGSNMPDYDVVTTYDRDEEGRVKSSKKTRTVKHADGTTSTNTKTTQPKQTQKKALPGQEPAQPKRPAKKRLPGT